MASQDVRLSKFKADFKQQQSEMTNKIDTVLKAITDQITRALPSDTVKYPKLTINFTALVFSARSYPTEDPECSTRIHSSINVITICPKQPDISRNNNPRGEEQEENDNLENTNTHPSSLPIHQSHSHQKKKDDEDVMFIEIIKKYVDSHEEELEEDENMMIREMGVEYFDIFLTRSKLAYHKIPMSGLRNFTYVSDFMIVEDISSIINPRLSQVVLGKPFIEVSNMTHDLSSGVVRFMNGAEEIAYKMPHKIE
ncbi:hypothetical protein Tco_0617453 [Tanacetum coccineum]